MAAAPPEDGGVRGGRVEVHDDDALDVSRVMRGGGWLVSGRHARPTDRFFNGPRTRLSLAGFRGAYRPLPQLKSDRR